MVKVYRTKLSPAALRLRGKLAAHVMHAANDARSTTQAAREAFHQKFEVQVDPEGILPPEERARRAEHARKAHYYRMALSSVRARRARKEARDAPR